MQSRSAGERKKEKKYAWNDKHQIYEKQIYESINTDR